MYTRPRGLLVNSLLERKLSAFLNYKAKLSGKVCNKCSVCIFDW